MERVPQYRYSRRVVYVHLSILRRTDGTVKHADHQVFLQHHMLQLHFCTVCPNTSMRTGGQEEWRSGKTEPSVVRALSEERIPHATVVFA